MERTCDTCAHYLGGGCCRINLEAECGAGEFEAWEPKGAEITVTLQISADEYEYLQAHMDEFEAYLRERLLAAGTEEIAKMLLFGTEAEK